MCYCRVLKMMHKNIFSPGKTKNGVVATAQIAKYPSAWSKELISYRSLREEVAKTQLLPMCMIHLRSEQATTTLEKEVGPETPTKTMVDNTGRRGDGFGRPDLGLLLPQPEFNTASSL